MPVSWEVDSTRGLLYVRLQDPVDLEQLKASMNEMREHPEIRPGLDVLSDHTELEGVAEVPWIGPLIDMLDAVAKRNEGIRIAVATRGDASFGMARMAESRSEGTGVRIRAFRTRESAEAWLASPRETPRGSRVRRSE